MNLTKKLHFNFKGSGSEYFGIEIGNWILTGITFGLYYPWAKANRLKYLYGNTYLDDSPFVFHGTGAEMFKGFIKAVLIIGSIYGFVLYATITENPTLVTIAMGVFYMALLILGPVAIHGSLRYRLSRTSWKTIHFGYRGKLGQLFKIFIKGFLLSILTLGIYTPWFQVELRRYILGHTRFGNVEFEFTGRGTELFIINLKAFFLIPLTLGIYTFWYMKEMYNFMITNTNLIHYGKQVKMQSNISGSDLFVLLFINWLIVMVTGGLGAPFATIRTLEFMASNIEIEEGIYLDAIEQTEEDYKDATSDDIADMLEFDI